MDNQQPSPASTPVNPSGTAYVPPPTNPPTPSLPPQSNPIPPSSLPPQTPIQSGQKSRSWMLILGSILLLLLIGGGGYFYFMNSQKPELKVMPVPTIKPLPTNKPTPIASSAATASVSADWKTYTNSPYRFSLQYPSDFAIGSETSSEITFGEQAQNGIIQYLTIITAPTKLTNYKELKSCSSTAEETTLPCIAKEGWQQKKPITDMLVDGKNAVSFYLVGGVDNAFHIVQITNDPKIELKMNVAGGGLESTFNKILSTFKFTK